mgnify:CR=1 FL=1
MNSFIFSVYLVVCVEKCSFVTVLCVRKCSFSLLLCVEKCAVLMLSYAKPDTFPNLSGANLSSKRAKFR